MNEKIQLPQDDVEDITQLTDEICRFIFEKIDEQDANIQKNVLLGMVSTIIFNKFTPEGAWIFMEKLISVLQMMAGFNEEEIEKE
jgi:hypothetical protein